METRTIHIETSQQIEEAIADLETRIHRAIEGSSREAKEKQSAHLPANIKALLEEKNELRRNAERHYGEYSMSSSTDRKEEKAALATTPHIEHKRQTAVTDEEK
ncbi:hypothetical protein HHI36_009162, partial [Cryptolaemus montrouzieri]